VSRAHHWHRSLRGAQALKGWLDEVRRLKMTTSPVMGVRPLGFPWETLDPFLFCVYHQDFYPAGAEDQGPAVSLAGRNLGNDFVIKDGWRMYHGQRVPGFPRHPHRGFETVTIARQGFIDHSDSMGATARFGQGDVQWMTAARGVEHSEMFPLRDKNGPNTGELFQLWLNLPKRSKMAEPNFTMLWSHTIPRKRYEGAEVVVVAGELDGATPPPPPPDSWASDPQSALAIWTIKLSPGARWTLPAGPAGVNRALYSFTGDKVQIADRALSGPSWARLSAEREVELQNNGAVDAEFLYLQGRPIGEPVVQYGPFVMNTQPEIQQAMMDYRRGVFGRWPWPSDAPVHARERGRFAIHADGRREEPPSGE
jgi:redox-sensitive bicupin YhaK (pirin superfamily)